jgi:hypothetical protein
MLAGVGLIRRLIKNFILLRGSIDAASSNTISIPSVLQVLMEEPFPVIESDRHVSMEPRGLHSHGRCIRSW